MKPRCTRDYHVRADRAEVCECSLAEVAPVVTAAPLPAATTLPRRDGSMFVVAIVMYALIGAALGAALVVSARAHARLERRVDFLEREVSAITAIVLEDLGRGCRPTVAEVGR